MSFPEAIFKVIEVHNCPYYAKGDAFSLSGKAVLLDHKSEKNFITTALIRFPEERECCSVLLKDITGVLIDQQSIGEFPDFQIACSGCTGLIRLAFERARRPTRTVPAIEEKKDRKDLSYLEGMLGEFSFFRVIDERNLKNLIPALKLRALEPGEVVIQKGELGQYLYVILTGRVEVIGRDGISIAFMGSGEIFGEMSLLSGDPTTATVRVVEPTKALCIDSKHFKFVLNRSPALQTYFARLLSRRLAEINMLRSEEFASGMVGNLREMPPTELFQTLNINQKTGVINLTLSKGPAEVWFRSGELIHAQYDGEEGKSAFYAILKEKSGRFKFTQGLNAEQMRQKELGDFNWLLMDGLRRIDEAGH